MNPLLHYEPGKREVTALADNLVAYWNFEGNLLDSINGHHGTETGIPAGGYSNNIIGLGEKCLDINKVVIPNHADFNFTTGLAEIPFSTVFWVLNTAGANGVWLLCKRNVNTERAWQVFLTFPKKLGLTLMRGSEFVQGEFLFDPPVNSLNQIITTYNGNKNSSGIEIYHNSVKQTLLRTSSGAGGAYSGMLPTTSDLTLGNGFIYGGNSEMDEVGIFKNRVLTQDDVNKLYNDGYGLSYPF